MKSIYELRYNDEIVGTFPTEDKAIKAMMVYIDYLKINNGIEVENMSAEIGKYTMLVMSNGLRLFLLERELFPTIKDFKRYLGL